MAEFNLNNLELDDNSFEVLPEGDYHFTVDSHEIGYYSGNSTKIPPNTQQIIVKLRVPTADGEVVVRNTFNIYKNMLFLLRQFSECIGMCPEKGKFAFNVDNIDGRTGVCSITVGESARGNKFNNVQTFYAPSKAPAVTENDDAWAQRDAFLEMGEDEHDPFETVSN